MGWLVVDKLNLYLNVNHIDALVTQIQMINFIGIMVVGIMVVLVVT